MQPLERNKNEMLFDIMCLMMLLEFKTKIKNFGSVMNSINFDNNVIVRTFYLKYVSHHFLNILIHSSHLFKLIQIYKHYF